MGREGQEGQGGSDLRAPYSGNTSGGKVAFEADPPTTGPTEGRPSSYIGPQAVVHWQSGGQYGFVWAGTMRQELVGATGCTASARAVASRSCRSLW